MCCQVKHLKQSSTLVAPTVAWRSEQQPQLARAEQEAIHVQVAPSAFIPLSVARSPLLLHCCVQCDQNCMHQELSRGCHRCCVLCGAARCCNRLWLSLLQWSLLCCHLLCRTLPNCAVPCCAALLTLHYIALCAVLHPAIQRAALCCADRSAVFCTSMLYSAEVLQCTNKVKQWWLPLCCITSSRMEILSIAHRPPPASAFLEGAMLF